MFSCKHWTSMNFVRSELTVVTLASPKHGKIIRKSMSQTKEKHYSLVLSRSGLWMVWRWHGILCVYCYFCLEPTVRKDTWRMRTTSVTVMVIFFKIGILKVTWSQLCLKSPLNNYKVHWQQIRYSSIFYGHGSKCMLNLLSRLW